MSVLDKVMSELFYLGCAAGFAVLVHQAGDWALPLVGAMAYTAVVRSGRPK